MSVSNDKIKALNERLQMLGVTEADLREDFIKGSGRGGQKINKSNTCVQLTFLKSGLVIKCQKTRNREDNRFFARRILLEKIEEELLGEKSEKGRMIHKIKAQKRKRNKRAKEKVLQDKRQQSDKKSLRKKPGID